MDDPALDRGRHVEALRALGRINRVSLASERVWREVARLHERAGGMVRVLDVACGAGDVLLGVAHRARRRDVPVELTGCDLSPVALDFARSAAADSGAHVQFLQLDVERERLPPGHDLVCSSLFLHHLSEESATRFLRALADAATSSMLVQDLRRTRLGWLLAWIGLHLFTRSEVARRDGLASVAAAFTLEEVARLCARAGLEDAVVERCWPQRFTLLWRRA